MSKCLPSNIVEVCEFAGNEAANPSRSISFSGAKETMLWVNNGWVTAA